MSEEKNSYVKEVVEKKYEHGFTTDVYTEIIDRGLDENVIRTISEKKNEPQWMLEFRLNAFRYWQTLEQPEWGHLSMPDIDYQAISYYADPMAKKEKSDKKEIDPELMKTFDKLGIP
ncbi:MAG: Fe-S cluster assembly protein SufB, partial [Bacteroidaceae bacterium]|nr:Fe-S cluster assembly protein SufB [Bacteroidaceae bacterium]